MQDKYGTDGRVLDRKNIEKWKAARDNLGKNVRGPGSDDNGSVGGQLNLSGPVGGLDHAG